jgi:ribosomal protein S18 acetylase RimI-like enzyme
MARETEGRELARPTLDAGVRRLLEREDRGFYWIAEYGGEAAGCLMITREWSDWRNGEFWWIQSVYVRPEMRRRGVYRTLHEHVVRQAASNPDVCGLRLYVERDNETAQRTYQALGMEQTAYRMFEQPI